MYFDEGESSRFVESLFHELQHGVDNLEGHPPGTSPNSISNIAQRLVENPDLFTLASDKMGDLLNKVPDSVDNTIKYTAYHLARFIKEIRGPLDAIFGGDFENAVLTTYEREMGESTARITSQIADASLTTMGRDFAENDDRLVADDGAMVTEDPDDSLGPYRWISFNNEVLIFSAHRPDHLRKLEKYLLKRSPDFPDLIKFLRF